MSLDWNVILTRLGNLFDCGILIWFLTKCFSLKVKNRWFWKCGVAFVILLAVLYLGFFRNWNHFLITSVWFVILFAYCRFCLNGDYMEQIIFCLICLLALPLVNIYFLQVISLSADMSVNEYISTDSWQYQMGLLWAKFLLFIILYTIAAFFRKQRMWISKLYGGIIAFLLELSILVQGILFYLIKSNEFSRSMRLGIFFISFGIVVIDIFLIICIYRMSVLFVKKEEMRMLEVQNKLQTDHIEVMQRFQEQYRRLRHDYKNHIFHMQELLRKGKTAELKKYLEDMDVYYLQQPGDYVTTQNPILDAVLNVKFIQCNEEGIDTSSIIVGDYSNMEIFRIGMIVSSLLDNAIEASRKESTFREISVEMYRTGVYVSILVKNRIHSSVLETNPGLLTSKAERTEHGIGIRHVRELVEQMNGMIDIYEKDGHFCVHAMVLFEKVCQEHEENINYVR